MKKEIKKIYMEILSVCEKHADKECLSGFEYDDIREMRDKARNHLQLIDWFERYGIEIPHSKNVHNSFYVNINNHCDLIYFQDAKEDQLNNRGRFIPYEDDGKQPFNEWLLQLSFPSGAYIFGDLFQDDYPKPFFDGFWQELKSYKPDYCDTANHGLYFSLENAKDIYQDFPEILQRYCKKNKEDVKKRKIQKMEKELEKLKA